MGFRRWRRLKPRDLPRAEEFLKGHESLCVSACARFLRFNVARDRIWALGSREEISCLLLNSGRTFYPLFNGDWSIPIPRFMGKFLRANPIHALQGLKEDVNILEVILEGCGEEVSDAIDYDLMGLSQAPSEESLAKGPPGMILREPLPSDLEALVSLQAAYEVEEVLPKGASFNPAASRLSLERSLEKEPAFVAELEGAIIGKAQVNGESFSRMQIGGVYVLPAYRGMGVATKMLAGFAQELLSRCGGLTLFVKKRNAPAQKAYRKIGFRDVGPYRICYY